MVTLTAAQRARILLLLVAELTRAYDLALALGARADDLDAEVARRVRALRAM